MESLDKKRFMILMKMVEKIIKPLDQTDLYIIRTPGDKWFVTLRDWPDGEPKREPSDTIEDALEAFVMSPTRTTP